jgi:hypothetical protein
MTRGSIPGERELIKLAHPEARSFHFSERELIKLAHPEARSIHFITASTLAAQALLPQVVGKQMRQAAQYTPPKGLLVDLLMSPDRAEDVLYNLQGRYEYWVEKYGPRRARLIFFTQSMGSVVSFWTDWLLHRVKLLQFLRHS